MSHMCVCMYVLDKNGKKGKHRKEGQLQMTTMSRWQVTTSMDYDIRTNRTSFLYRVMLCQATFMPDIVSHNQPTCYTIKSLSVKQKEKATKKRSN